MRIVKKFIIEISHWKQIRSCDKYDLRLPICGILLIHKVK